MATMATFEEGIKEVITALEGVDPASLERKGNDYNFSDVQHLAVEMFKFIDWLKEAPNIGVHLSEEKKQAIYKCLNGFRGCANRMQTFSLNIPQPEIQKAEIEGAIRNIHEQTLIHLLPALRLATIEKNLANQEADALAKKIDDALSAFEEQKHGVLASFQEKVEQLDTSIQEKMGEAESVLKMIREVSANQGVSKFAEIFDDQAKQNKKVAKEWLVASGFMAFVICIVLVWIFSSVKNNPGLDGFLQFTLAKVLLMSFLLVIFHHTVKNYNANMHLHVLNEHRKNSLETFEAFFHAAKDPKIRDAVLIQATRAIFEAGETGYVSSKGGGNMTGIETIKIADSGKD